MSKYTIGIDLGGTTMTAGLVDESYQILGKVTWATRLPRPAEDLEQALADLCRTVAKNAGVSFSDVRYVGIGTPGSVNFTTGFVGYNTNFGYYDWNLGPDLEGLLGCKICKNLFLTNRQQTDFYLLVMPGEKPFKTKLLSKQIGSARLSFASAEHMEKYLDITPGSVSILGLMNDKGGAVRLLVDRDLLKEEYFGCHPCINTSSLRLKTADVLEKLLPAMGHKPSFVDLPWVIEE